MFSLFIFQCVNFVHPYFNIIRFTQSDTQNLKKAKLTLIRSFSLGHSYSLGFTELISKYNSDKIFIWICECKFQYYQFSYFCFAFVNGLGVYIP